MPGEYFCFKSGRKTNPLGLEWEYHMIEEMLEDVNMEELAKLILIKEKETLKEFPPYDHSQSSDGYTQLGKESLTSRSYAYNLLKWNHPEINKLKLAILKAHNQLIKLIKIDRPARIYCHAWANVMRKGEQIKPHLHDATPDSYVSGHITVQCEASETHYICPVDQINSPSEYKSKNVPGKITLFQSCIPHYTSKHEGDKERISIAFDLITDNNSQFFTNNVAPLKHWLFLTEGDFLKGTGYSSQDKQKVIFHENS